jgi:predicted transcriptional regulator
VLAKLLAEREGTAAGEEDETGAVDGLAARILEAFGRLGGSAGIREIERETGAKRERLRPVLKELIGAGRLRRTGERKTVRYHRNDQDQPDQEDPSEAAG